MGYKNQKCKPSIYDNCQKCGGEMKGLTWVCRGPLHKRHTRRVTVKEDKDCPRCGQSRRGPVRLYCSDKCRQRAADYRAYHSEAGFAGRLKQYGLTSDEYWDMHSRAKGACEACRLIPFSQLGVDHDHHTGLVRGLLCNHCNLALGYLKNDLGVIQGLASYLENVEKKRTSAFT